MQQRLSGLGPLVALSVARYRESGSRAFISVGDVERVFSIDGRGAAALADRLFAELPFLGSQVPADSTGAGDAHEIREDIARYAGIQTTDEYLKIRADEIRGHPQFGWGRWEPDRLGTAYATAGPAGGCFINPGPSASVKTILGMAQNFIECDREQLLLMSPSLREWLPENHLAWFVIEAVKDIDLAPFYARYREDGWGRAAYDPAMMVAIMLYAYARASAPRGLSSARAWRTSPTG